jgi:hypothetical protein
LSLEINAESLVLQRSGGGQTMKIQAKDCPQGGLFQMEPEPGTVEVTNLATGWRYTGVAPGSGRLCISNGRIGHRRGRDRRRLPRACEGRPNANPPA